MDRKFELINAIKNEIAKERIQHVQVLVSRYNGDMAVKFTCVDTDYYAKKVKGITDRFCESMALAKALKTTQIYTI